MVEIFRTLFKYKKVEIIGGVVYKDYVHLCVSISPKLSVSEFVGYLKRRSVLMIMTNTLRCVARRIENFGQEGTMFQQLSTSIKRYIAEQKESR